MSRSSEVVTLLRSHAPLVALLPGGIYLKTDLGEEGITSRVHTAAAYLNGQLRPCAVVAELAPVPALQFVSFKNRQASATQALFVFLYARRAYDTLVDAHDLVFTLLHGYRLSGTWPLLWSGALGPIPAPELPQADMIRCDIQALSIRRPVPV
jgi:hypothetical protein